MLNKKIPSPFTGNGIYNSKGFNGYFKPVKLGSIVSIFAKASASFCLLFAKKRVKFFSLRNTMQKYFSRNTEIIL